MCNCPLSTCPEEIVVIIVSHIEERCDLLNLALTSKLFQRIIIPSFLDLNHIRCDPRRIDVWQWITSKPQLAKRTWALELVDESAWAYWGKAIIPSFSQGFDKLWKWDVYEECVLSLAAAVMHMTHLRRFRWSVQLPFAYAFESLFISLGQQNNMDEFYFRLGKESEGECCRFNGWQQWIPVKFRSLSPLGNFYNITTFSLTVSDAFWPDDESGLVQDWIMQFTNLKHLQLNFRDNGSCFDFSVICDRAYWPSLIELSLHKVEVFPIIPEFILPEDYYDYDTRDADNFATFLHNHPTLERLYFVTDDDYRDFIQPQTVTQLRTLVLKGCNYPAEPLGNWFPQDISQQIQYLECSISAETLPVLRAMTSLRVLHVIDMELEIFQHVVEAVPHIQQLYIPYWYWYTRHKAYHLGDTVASSLFKLRHLVQLEGRLVYPKGNLSENQHIIKRLRQHECLLFVDSVPREQWDLLLNPAALREFPCASVPKIEKSADFYIVNHFD